MNSARKTVSLVVLPMVLFAISTAVLLVPVPLPASGENHAQVDVVSATLVPTPANGSVALNQNLTMRASVRNNGSLAATDFVVQMLPILNSIETVYFPTVNISVGSLDPAFSVVLDFNYTPGQVGSWTFSFQVVDGGTYGSVSVNVENYTIPDEPRLIIEGVLNGQVTWDTGYAVYARGVQVDMTLYLNNSGTAPASDVILACRVDGLEIWTHTVTSIDAGPSSLSFTVTWNTSGATPGDHEITWLMNGSQYQMLRTRITNVQLQVLQLNATGQTEFPLHSPAGASYEAVVFNAGPGDASDIVCVIALDNQTHATPSIASLAEGAEARMNFTIPTLTLSAGAHGVRFTVNESCREASFTILADTSGADPISVQAMMIYAMVNGTLDWTAEQVNLTIGSALTIGCNVTSGHDAAVNDVTGRWHYHRMNSDATMQEPVYIGNETVSLLDAFGTTARQFSVNTSDLAASEQGILYRFGFELATSTLSPNSGNHSHTGIVVLYSLADENNNDGEADSDGSPGFTILAATIALAGAVALAAGTRQSRGC